MSTLLAVAFRVDASLQIGTGHLMRCLTLADALREQGWRSHFLCREHPGHLGEVIQQRGHAVRLLSKPPPAPAAPPTHRSAADHPEKGEPPLAHAAWLGCCLAVDAAETAAVLSELKPTWLVVDHYALDRRWEQLQRPHVRHILAIDDLADRAHDVDLLLDQNLGRATGDYDALLPDHARRLLGPRFALLRPEFAAMRAASLARRQQQQQQQQPALGHILITLGGVDKDNATGTLLQALIHADLPADTRITVVMGPHAPWLEQVRQLAADLPCTTEVQVNTPHMAHLMADADLAIGAAGSTSWERCCLGLPTLMVVLADNQRGGATALAACGAAHILELDEPRLSVHLKTMLASFRTPGSAVMARMSECASSIINGTGTQAVRQAMQEIEGAALQPPQNLTAQHITASPRLRPLHTDDLNLVRQWRNSEAVRRWMFSTNTITEQEHRKWFEKNANNPLRHLLVYTEDNTRLGFMNISVNASSKNAEWGFYIAPDAPPGTGQRLGKAALMHAFDVLELHKVCGHVLHFNQRSIRLHEKLGFQLEGKLRDEHFAGSSYHDVMLFGLLRTDYLHA